MSVDTGRDIPHDVFGGTLTEVGPSNMPSGGSPQNRNVEFLAGLIRTRGGLNPQLSYSGIAGGPFSVRYVKDFEQVPGQPVTLALLVNPTTNPSGLLANSANTTIGSIYGYGGTQPWAPYVGNPAFSGPLAKSCTQFSREYIAVSEGRWGYDIPRQWDGTYFDRVSQCGVGLAPTAADNTNTFAMLANGLQQFSTAIPAMGIQANLGGGLIVTVLLEQTLYNFVNNMTGIAGYPIGQQPNNAIQVGDTVTIAGCTPNDYNGAQTVSNVLYTVEGVLIGFQYIIATTPVAPSVLGTLATQFTAVQTNGSYTTAPVQGSMVTVQGSATAGYNGSWPVRYVPPASLTSNTYPLFVITNATGLGNASDGTIIQPGSISAGLHGVSVAFILRTGYITKPAPPNYWVAKGSRGAVISDIATGPSNTVGRLLIFTPYITPPATTGTFYSIRQSTTTSTVMQINDNTTTQFVVNFTDSDLTTGFNAEYLFGLIELGECSGCFPYAGRMFWWGELNSMQDFLNMEFNGGWKLAGGTGGADLPRGWTSDPVNGAGGSRVANGGVWQDAYKITGTGASGPVGMITQGAFQNYLKNALLLGATSFSARITALASSPNDQLVLDIFSPTVGVLATSALGSFAAGYFTQIFAFSANMPATIPADTVIRLYALNLGNAASITVDRVQIYPTNQPINYTVLRASYPSDPESFDGVTGLIQPVYNNGQAVRGVYTVRDSMYIDCDRSGFVTKDVAGSEPASWTCDPVSATIGTTGATAVGIGDDWVVKANRYGLYIYLGREPEKISQEIQSLWNKQGLSNIINWKYAYLIWVTVDLQKKRIIIGAPVNGSTVVNQIFVMDYQTLDTSEMIAEYPTLRFSPYTGRRVILEQGRKWTIWTFQTPAGGVLSIPCGAFVEQSDGTAELLLGNGNGDNNLYFIDDTQRGNDNEAPVDSRYTTHFFPTQDEEQQLELRSHMHLFSLLRMYPSGSGTMGINIYKNTLAPSPTNPRLAWTVNLQNPGLEDSEKTADLATAERWAVEWFTNTLDSWFQVERVTRVVEQDPNGLLRGVNFS